MARTRPKKWCGSAPDFLKQRQWGGNANPIYNRESFLKGKKENIQTLLGIFFRLGKHISMSATKGATIKDVANVRYGNQDRKTVNTGGPRIS